MIRIKYFLSFIATILTLLFFEACKRGENGRFTNKFKEVDSLFANYDSASPGCTIGIVYQGDLIYKKGYGMADIENQIKNSPDKLFDIASTSKQFTAFCILLLEEQGKLSIDDKIRKYIPELPECYDHVLIKHLLTHTSGIRDHYALMDLTGIKEISSEKQNWANHNYNEKVVFDILLKQNELNFPPGTYYQYCNSGFYLAGKIIERISGLSLGEFYKNNLFTPLGIKNTFLYDESTFYHKNRTMGYSRTKEGYRRNLIKYETYGDGQIMTNIYDLFIWDKNFYNNKLGKGDQKIIDKMYTRGQLNDGESVDYSVGGLEVSKYKGLDVVDRMGGTQGICSDIVRFPNQKFTVICLSNYDDLNPDPWRAALKVADIFLGEYYKSSKSSMTSESSKKGFEIPVTYLNKITGLYFNEKSKELCVVELKDEKLKLNGKNLLAIDSSSFKIEGWFAKIQFNQSDSGVTGMNWQSFTNPVENFTKKKYIEYDNNSLKGFTGNYYCSELDLICQIKLKNSQLILKDSGQKESNLKPLFKDVFESGYNGQKVIIEFVLDSFDRITSLRVNTGWIKNLKFERLYAQVTHDSPISRQKDRGHVPDRQ